MSFRNYKMYPYGAVADPETSRGGGEFANKLLFFSENISIYRNKVRTIILIKV